MNYELFIYILAWVTAFISTAVISLTYYAFSRLSESKKQRAAVHINGYLLSLIVSIVYIVTYNLS